MKTGTLKTIAIVLTLGAVGAVFGNGAATDTTLNQIAGYRQWTRVTQKPLVVGVDISSFAG